MSDTVHPLPPPLSPEELAALPQARFEGRVILAQSPEEAEGALDCLTGQIILGFDTETRPTFKKGVSHPPALVQLAGEGLVVLLRGRAFEAWDLLAQVLGDPDVVKAGVAVRDDVTALTRLGPFTAAGFVDVGEWAKSLGWPKSGLRNLAGVLLGLRVSKKARLTNWAARTLTPAQVAYAATDAWVSREIYLFIARLMEKGNSPLRACAGDRQCPALCPGQARAWRIHRRRSIAQYGEKD